MKPGEIKKSKLEQLKFSKKTEDELSKGKVAKGKGEARGTSKESAIQVQRPISERLVAARPVTPKIIGDVVNTLEDNINKLTNSVGRYLNFTDNLKKDVLNVIHDPVNRAKIEKLFDANKDMRLSAAKYLDQVVRLSDQLKENVNLGQALPKDSESTIKILADFADLVDKFEKKDPNNLSLYDVETLKLKMDNLQNVLQDQVDTNPDPSLKSEMAKSLDEMEGLMKICSTAIHELKSTGFSDERIEVIQDELQVAFQKDVEQMEAKKTLGIILMAIGTVIIATAVVGIILSAIIGAIMLMPLFTALGMLGSIPGAPGVVTYGLNFESQVTTYDRQQKALEELGGILRGLQKEEFQSRKALVDSEKGRPEDIAFVAKAYFDGLGVPKDVDLATEYLKKLYPTNPAIGASIALIRLGRGEDLEIPKGE